MFSRFSMRVCFWSVAFTVLSDNCMHFKRHVLYFQLPLHTVYIQHSFPSVSFCLLEAGHCSWLFTTPVMACYHVSLPSSSSSTACTLLGFSAISYFQYFLSFLSFFLLMHLVILSSSLNSMLPPLISWLLTHIHFLLFLISYSKTPFSSFSLLLNHIYYTLLKACSTDRRSVFLLPVTCISSLRSGFIVVSVSSPHITV